MKKPSAEIKNLVRELRPFVSFNYDLRKRIHSRSIGKIKRYAAELKRLKSYPTIKYYRPRARRYKRAALEHTILDPALKQFKVIPLGDVPPSARIRLTKAGQLKAKSERVDVMPFTFDPEQLALADTAYQYIESIVAQYGYLDTWRIRTGRSLTHKSYNRIDIIHAVIYYMQKYKNWQDWLIGIVGYAFKNQVNNNNFIKEKLK